MVVPVLPYLPAGAVLASEPQAKSALAAGISGGKNNVRTPGGADVTRAEYDVFHQYPEKRIDGDIAFAPRPSHPSILMAGPLPIVNPHVADARLEIHYNPEVGSKIFTIVSASAQGAICRLCVDGQSHDPYGRSHKHRLQTPTCPRQNLKHNIVTHPELSGQSIVDLFSYFCQVTNIQFGGQFTPPADSQNGGGN
jgi:hypothetical protein